MEGLNNMIITTSPNGWFKGFDVAMNSHYSQEITHLQYADDTLTFRDVVVEQLKILRTILILLEGISCSNIHKYRDLFDS